ncbi:MAG TPA: universal stress protein [Gaiellaceae bacterium]|nr:universal stress protein [Gaiellaceae bacterium]
MPRRRRREQSLERVLGTPALFATAYGNVGSSIYYALGLTAVYALGLTPVVFVVAGIIFAATAATYAEGTVRYPEAGGSSSFARHAYNELVSFGAAWAQMLVYVVTVATSAFFVPHYLSIFWGPLDRNPWDVVGGIVVIVVLVVLNTVGVQEATRVSVILAVIDFATQVFLVVLGFVLVLHPHVLTANVHFGTAPTWTRLAIAVPVAMLAYTGVETVSNLAEEARDPTRSVPSAYKLVAGAVFAIYFTLPLVALSAMPVTRYKGGFSTELARGPEQGGHANDPVLGIVDNLGVHGTTLHLLRIYVGILAATILFIATNAGVIGASRITYSMATYRQIPEVFRRLHPRFKTPWLAIVIFAGIAPICVILPGSVTFVGTLYSFGATLSFTVAHASIVALRRKDTDSEILYRAKPNLRLRGVDWPLFAVVGGVATGISFLVILVQNPTTRWVGLGWLAVGFVAYTIYRRRYVEAPLTETTKAPPLMGPALALEYRTIISPVVDSPQSREALHIACRLASERRSSIVAMRVVVVPVELPLDADLPQQEKLADRLLDEAHDIGELYGVRVIERLVRARHAGRAIVEEAARRNAEIIVIGAPRLPHRTRRSAIFGKTVDYVLKNAECRVMVGAGRRAAA